MAAPVLPTQERNSQRLSETAIKKRVSRIQVGSIISIPHFIPTAKILFVLGKASTQTRQNFKIARDVEPPLGGERGAPWRAKNCRKLGAKSMGGFAGRPPIGF